MLKRSILCFCIIFALCFISSCSAGNGDSSTTKAEIENTVDTSGELLGETTAPEETESFIDKEKYPPDEGLKSADEIVKCGLGVNGAYYEGAEVTYSGLYCSKTAQSSIGDNSMYVLYLKDKVPEGCPIIAIGTGDSPEYILKDSERSIRRVTYYRMNDANKTYNELPTEPGLYWAQVVTSEIPLPSENDNYELPDELTEYVLAYQYIYLLIIE
jgi:hypothetical protein